MRMNSPMADSLSSPNGGDADSIQLKAADMAAPGGNLVESCQLVDNQMPPVEVGQPKAIATTTTTVKRDCAICRSGARYCCPKCSLRTCSLACVRTHKRQTGCDGIRDRAAFIAMNQFTNLDLLSDYRFLEESARMVDSAVRNRIVKPHRRENLPPNLTNMQKFAWRRNRISLQFLPQMFSRRRQNRTTIKKAQLHWTLELCMPQAQLVLFKHDVSSSVVTKDLVIQLLATLSVEEKEKAAALINSPVGDICVFMKVVGRPANDESYFELDIDSTLDENLRGKRVIEFPTLVIVTKDHQGAFRLERMPKVDYKQTELPLFFQEADGSDEDQMGT